MRLLAAVLLGAIVAASGCLELSPAQVAASVQSAQCERFVGLLKKSRDAGASCSVALADAKKAEPLCALDLKCPSFEDAGTGEGGL